MDPGELSASPGRVVPERFRRRERLYWMARGGVALVVASLVWAFVRWPDARRVPVPCAVLEHSPPVRGKRGHDGKVRVRVDEREYWFVAVAREQTTAAEASAFAEWPIGTTRTCWKLPYATASAELAVTGSGGSLLPPVVTLVLGLATVAVALASGTRRQAAPDAPVGSPYRERPRDAPAFPDLVVQTRTFVGKRRTWAWVVLAFWAVLFGAFFLLGATAPSPAGSLLEPGSMARLGVALFALCGLGIPGGFMVWPSLYTLLARTTLSLDAAHRGAGHAEGVPGLRITRWVALPRDVALSTDSLTAGEGGPSLLSIPPVGPDDRRAVEQWLERWREDWHEDRDA
jgi:hypothetical protein